MPDTVIVSPPDNQAIVSPVTVKQIFPADNRAIVTPHCEVALRGPGPGVVVSPPDNECIAEPPDYKLWPAVAPGNDYKRSYSYKTGTLTFPATPQAYGMEWEDANEVFWQCFAGDTVWEKVNHLAPGV